jgi:PD-(D/E)XK endonuclease
LGEKSTTRREVRSAAHYRASFTERGQFGDEWQEEGSGASKPADVEAAGRVGRAGVFAESLESGFCGGKAVWDSDRYDFIVDSGKRLLRVQVKSASCMRQGAYFITTHRCANGVAIPYTREEIDFMAAYVFPEDTWFVVPVKEFEKKTSIHVFPRERGEHGMYADYREAWCQLVCGEAGAGGKLEIESRCGRGWAGAAAGKCPLHTRPPTRLPVAP